MDLVSSKTATKSATTCSQVCYQFATASGKISKLQNDIDTYQSCFYKKKQIQNTNSWQPDKLSLM